MTSKTGSLIDSGVEFEDENIFYNEKKEKKSPKDETFWLSRDEKKNYFLNLKISKNILMKNKL